MRHLPLLLLLIGCTSSGQTGTMTDGRMVFPPAGPVAGDEDAFTFGVATAAAQIEDQDVASDWYAFTQPSPEGAGKGVFVGDAVKGFTMAREDVGLLEELGMDAYRFNPSWSRIEPQRDAIDPAALAHYGTILDDMAAAGIKPMLTVHHFSSPAWVDSPLRNLACPEGPTDSDLCGWNHPEGAELILEEIAEHARLLAETYGDRVDEWCTVNEPINYIAAAYGAGAFPPGRALAFDVETFGTVLRNYVRAHVVITEAIRQADVWDADGDGQATQIGFTLNTNKWVAAANGEVSDAEVDIAARDSLEYVYHHLFADSILNGTFDADFDGIPEESHPEWVDHLDFLGVQYYARLGVSGSPALLPGIEATPCYAGLTDFACVPPVDASKWVPDMHYELDETGAYDVLMDFADRWPGLPLLVSESGLATHTGVRRSEHIVRALEQIQAAREDGADVRGYYHWSLMDNFEWAEGFEPRFGLYQVDLSTYERTPTHGADTYAEITAGRSLTAQMRETYGGTGPMTPESD
jgi:beta-glucosidase